MTRPTLSGKVASQFGDVSETELVRVRVALTFQCLDVFVIHHV